MSWVKSTFEKVPQGERVALAERALDLYTQMPTPYYAIPSGIVVPDAIDRWPSSEVLGERWLQEDEIFKDITDVCSGLPPDWTALQERVKNNRRHMQVLAARSSSRRMRLSLHKLPPFFDDFDGKVKKWYNLPECVNGAEYVVTKEHLGEGGFGTVYKVQADDGRVYALKLLHPRHVLTGHQQDTHHDAGDVIRKGLVQRQELFRNDWFARLEFITWNRHDSFRVAVMKEFVPGKTVYQVLRSFDGPDSFTQRMAAAYRIVLPYAHFLQWMHHQGLLFVENRWDNVMKHGDTIKVIDYDFVTPIAEMGNAEHDFVRCVSSRSFASRQQRHDTLQRTLLSDVECFALMLDQWFVGYPWISGKDYGNMLRHMDQAAENKRAYPRERMHALPKPIRQVVHDLLRYPQDESLTIDDVVSALEML
ncbi:MAG TPA: serine/threonine-protein kinase [Candidatus Nanoarchaeia archaeon]|nr:serine/threonine-protein kinase [Candidatus Nanoarchaeia archaeon]